MNQVAKGRGPINKPGTGSIFVGTSGYSYRDWVGHFYPKGMKQDQFLSYYADHFPAVEINYTYYKMPTEKVLGDMVEKSGGKIEFVLKLHQEMTHSRSAGEKEFNQFRNALAPLVQAGSLGPLLAQFPYSFHATEKNGDYLRTLKDHLFNEKVVVELRNSKWVRQKTFDLLKELDFGYCCVDEPKIKGLMPDLTVATSKIGYVRFHGRNREKWYNHQRPEERYDYRYCKEELEPWAGKIRKLAALTNKVYCFHNNHYQSKSTESAQLLMKLLQ